MPTTTTGHWTIETDGTGKLVRITTPHPSFLLEGPEEERLAAVAQSDVDGRLISTDLHRWGETVEVHDESTNTTTLVSYLSLAWQSVAAPETMDDRMRKDMIIALGFGR